ncbi:MAG: hypothetical protein CR960_01910 [Pasteurellales bacterium]|nr:MAG: hypothetical protein CR960_01910 [Pasteurellales bacterium]
MKKILTVLMLSSFALTACKEEPKTTANAKQPNAEHQKTEKVQQNKIDETIQSQENDAVSSEQNLAKIENDIVPLTEEEKKQELDKKVEAAKNATIDAAQKLTDVLELKMGEVSQTLTDKLNQIDIDKEVTEIKDKINEIDIQKVTEPLKENINKLNDLLDNLDIDVKIKQSKEQPEETKEDGFL